MDYSNKTLFFQTQPQRQDLMFNTHTDLWIFFNIKQSLRKFFFPLFVFVIPLAQGLWQQVGVKGSWSCHWAVTGHKRRAPAWEWLHSHTQEYSPTGQPHHTHNTDADVYPASTTALQRCTPLWVSPICENPNSQTAKVEGGCLLYKRSNHRLLLNGQQSKCIEK